MIDMNKHSTVNDFTIIETFFSAVLKSTANCLKLVDSSISINDSYNGNVSCWRNDDNEQSSTCFFQPLDDFHYSFLHYVQTMDMEKPQSHFKDNVATDCKCFHPHLKEKHNAKSEFHCERSLYFLLQS